MDLGHDVGLHHVECVEAPVDEDTLPVQHRAHRAVADEHAFLERFQERFHTATKLTKDLKPTKNSLINLLIFEHNLVDVIGIGLNAG